MPALYTHYTFGQEVLKTLNKKQQQEIIQNIDYYNMFNQGFDNLYYHFPKWQHFRNFGINAHKKNISEFFKNTFEYIMKNNLINNSEITNIIYGFINHYTLDTLTHPYINYQVKNLNIPHTKIEFILDSKLWNNQKSKFYKIIIPRLNFSQSLTNLLNDVFFTTYKENNIGKVFNHSHNNSYYIYRYFIYDKYGFKTFIYKLVDLIIPFKELKLHKNTFFIKKFDERLLNKEKIFWHPPQNKAEIYNYSYEELINLAFKICLKLNNLAYQILHNQKNIDELISQIELISLQNITLLLQ